MKTLEMTDLDHASDLLDIAADQFAIMTPDEKARLALQLASLRLDMARLAHQREIDLIDRGRLTN